MRNKKLEASLLKQSNHGMLFHYMDHVNRTSYTDPLLVRRKSRRSRFSHIVVPAAIILACIMVMICAR